MSDMLGPHNVTMAERLAWQIERQAVDERVGLQMDIDKGAEIGVDKLVLEPCQKIGWQCTLFLSVERPTDTRTLVALSPVPTGAISNAYRRFFALKRLE